ncbi:hypothetical protein C8Q80DRAFT_1214298, partial [Daedaleopsis nitida]
MVRWPSGLRRQTKVYHHCLLNLVRKGVGSNPTLINVFLSLQTPEKVEVGYRQRRCLSFISPAIQQGACIIAPVAGRVSAVQRLRAPRGWGMCCSE